MAAKIDGDENQFVASGKLLANDFLIPYRDYPYFHLLYLVFTYATLFKFTTYILLAARICSVVCAWFTLITVFFRIPVETPILQVATPSAASGLSYLSA